MIWDNERKYLYLGGYGHYVGVYLPEGFRFWKRESITGNVYFKNEDDRISINLSSKGLVMGVPEGSVEFLFGGMLDIFEEREIGVEFVSNGKVEINSSVGNIVAILEDAPSPYGFVEDEGFEEYEDVYEEEED